MDQGEEPDGDARFEGAVFGIYNKNSYSVTRKDQEDDSYPTDAEVMRVTADAAGLAETAAVLQAGTYLVKELTAPEGYLLSEEELLFTILEDKPGEIVDLTETPVRDQVIRGGFALSKWDLELNEPGKSQGDATLEGAEFTLTNESEHSVLVNGRKIAPGEVIDTFRTDAEGKIETAKDLLPYGSYKLEETCPPTGYTRDGENLQNL
ncbi:MAG: SpaA isopeptide-forming pilin-related protein [Lachnospiraceae bacterium]